MTQGVVMPRRGSNLRSSLPGFCPAVLDLTPKFGRNPSYPAPLIKTDRLTTRKRGPTAHGPNRPNTPKIQAHCGGMLKL